MQSEEMTHFRHHRKVRSRYFYLLTLGNSMVSNGIDICKAFLLGRKVFIPSYGMLKLNIGKISFENLQM